MKKQCIFTLLLLLIVTGIQAQQEEKKARTAEPSTQIQAGILAGELASYGYRNSAPLALATAAEILIKNPPHPLVSEKQEAGPASTTQTAAKTKRPVVALDAPTLLQDARKLAISQNDSTALTVIGQVERTPKSRGRVYGPAKILRRVQSQSSYTDYVLFEGKDLAEVAIVGDGDCDLDIYVYDTNNNLIVKDDDNSDRCYVSFIPYYRTSFRIKIINRSNVYADYVLMTN